MKHFDSIQLTNDQVNQIIDYIQEYEITEQASIKNTQRILNEKLNLTQERISKLIDMRIDEKIDGETYHKKLE